MSFDREPAIFQEDYLYGTALERLAVTKHPVDELEPLPEKMDYERGYRDGAKRFLFVLNSALAFIHEGKNKDTALYQVAFALGASLIGGRSMQDVADSLGVKRAALSKGARSFVVANDLQPSAYMKSSESAESYRQARIESIDAANIAAQNN